MLQDKRLDQKTFYELKGFLGYYLDENGAVRSFKRSPLGKMIPWVLWKKKRKRQAYYVQLCQNGKRLYRTEKQILFVKIDLPLKFVNGKFIPWEKCG